MEKNKIFAAVPGIILAIIFALPLLFMVFVPLSILTLLVHAVAIFCLGILGVIAERPFNSSSLIDLAEMLCFIITVLLVYTYPLTYLFAIGTPFKSLDVPFKAKKVSLLTFLPLLHVAVFAIFYFVTSRLDETYKAMLTEPLDMLAIVSLALRYVSYLL